MSKNVCLLSLNCHFHPSVIYTYLSLCETSPARMLLGVAETNGLDWKHLSRVSVLLVDLPIQLVV